MEKLNRGQPWKLPRVPDAEIAARHRKVHAVMKKRGLDCLIVAGSQSNYGSGAAYIRYLTNYKCYYADEYLVFPLKGKPLLLLWSLTRRFTAGQVSNVPVQTSGWHNFVRDTVTQITKAGCERGMIGIAGMEVMPASMYVGLSKALPRATFIPASDLIMDIRSVKSPNELKFVRQAGKLADLAYAAMVRSIKAGVPEYEVFAALEHAILKHGGEAPCFILTGSGPAPTFPCSPASHRILKRGDTVLNEISPCYGGYWVQLCRPISIGKPHRCLVEMYELAMEAYRMGRKLLKPGVTYGDIHHPILNFITEQGCEFLAPTLQIVGLDITERIAASAQELKAEPGKPWETVDTMVLKEGMVIVNHPHVCDGKMGMVIGDTFIITRNGASSTSKCPLEFAHVR